MEQVEEVEEVEEVRASREVATFHFFNFVHVSICLLLVGVVPVSAGQLARPAVVAVDSSVAIDRTQTVNGTDTSGLTMDAVMSMGLPGGFEGIVRPWVQRAPNGEWNRQIWVATMRYERPGAIGLRVDAGLIPSPIGLANLMLRPQLNPTVALPASLFQPLPAVEFGAPRTTLLGAVYAFGANASLSGRHWDTRAAFIDTSPLRTRRIFSATNPPRFNNVVIGAGLTPFVGLRVGSSVTHGGWERAGESPTITQNRDATIVTIESELAYRFTKVQGEWVRDLIETNNGTAVASGWFVQAQQTITPRWFAAARVERMTAPAFTAFDTYVDQELNGVEETIGFRITPDLTLRGDHRARRIFGRTTFDHQVAVSAVWWRRWR
ncbi:MAG TPA: hypothetical protein VGF24_35355 [Vicinamibacterales bacterium]